MISSSKLEIAPELMMVLFPIMLIVVLAYWFHYSRKANQYRKAVDEHIAEQKRGWEELSDDDEGSPYEVSEDVKEFLRGIEKELEDQDRLARGEGGEEEVPYAPV